MASKYPVLLFLLFPFHFLLPLIFSFSQLPTAIAIVPQKTQETEAINIGAVTVERSVIVHGVEDYFFDSPLQTLRHPWHHDEDDDDGDDDDDGKVIKNDEMGMRQKEDLLLMVVYAVIVAIFLGYPQAGILLIIVWFFMPSRLCTCRP